MASTLPLSSLRLFVPPLRLLTAALWQVAEQQSVKHYGMLEDFVSLVTEAIPQLLTDRQKSLLLLGLRAKVSLCDPQAVHTHLDKPHSVSETEEEVASWFSSLSALTDKQSPADRRRLLQDVFGPSFDSALLSIISDFLSRVEQLFPVPDFKQAASWLHAAPAGVEDSLQQVSTEELRELMTNQSCRIGQTTSTVSPDSEQTLLSAWSHPLLTKLTNPDPPAHLTEVQSEVPPDPGSPFQLAVELVKVEVVVMTEDVQGELQEEELQEEELQQEELQQEELQQEELQQEELQQEELQEEELQEEELQHVEETLISDMTLLEEQEVDGSSTGDGDVCVVTPVAVEEDRLKGSPANLTDQSEGTDQSVTANALHSISHNSQRVAHRCPQCGKCYIYRSQVIRHLRTSRSCSSGVASGAVNLMSQPVGQVQEPHLPVPRPPRTHSCFQCNAVFKTKAELMSHQRSHRTRPVYQCNTCDREFHHLSSLSNHKQTHLDSGGFSCSRCDKVFETAKERDAHRLTHRPPDLTCTVCEQAFSSQTQLLRHLQTHSVEGAEPCYNCRFCDQTFKGVTQLRIHQRSHTSRSFQCDQCSKSYGSLTGLQSHRASHSAESRFLCAQCGKRFKTRDGLEGHLRTHTGERPYRCPYCPKDFTALAGLNVHVRRHTGERPYVCTVCGKGWPSGGDLQKHMRIHTGERPYVCQDCGKAFSISCHLTEHRRIHTGKKPFSCPECGKCLRRKFDLKKHMLSHSSVRPYACVFCSKSYTRKTHLNRHLLTHQAGEGEVLEEKAEER
ncbi:uncharacterized protein LOC141786247 isoform X2 [Halichoeres trimaculatus]|uniref:uncharacterized protein LOC141786247 isoform X2 n=1 Tax=Halichoeres trimaculatus TaxID=147232 RepID=UPI003D9EF6F0